MVRYLASGYRDFTLHPVPVDERLNWEFYMVADGEMAPVFPDRREVPMESEYAWVIPPGLAYGWRSGAMPPKRYVVHFTSMPEAIQQSIDERGYFGRKVTSEEILQIEKIYDRLQRHAMSFSPLSALKVQKAQIDLSLLLLTGVKLASKVPLDKVDEQRVESVMVWYREHMSECPTIDAAASAIHLSAGHLRRTFQRVRGSSPHEVFLKMRMERAKELLSTTSQDLLQIGRQCGFGSDSDFCRVFAKQAGVSPHKWRTNITKHEAVPERG